MHPILDDIARAQFEEASTKLQSASLTLADLPLIELARQNLFVHRVHLIRSLAQLEASQLFSEERERIGPTWCLDG